MSALVEKIVLDIPCEAKGSSGCPLLSYLPVPALQLTRGDKGLQGPPQGGRVSTAGERVEHETACVKWHAKSQPSLGLGSLLLLFIDVCFSTLCSSSLESWVDIADATRREERGTAKWQCYPFLISFCSSGLPSGQSLWKRTTPAPCPFSSVCFSSLLNPSFLYRKLSKNMAFLWVVHVGRLLCQDH